MGVGDADCKQGEAFVVYGSARCSGLRSQHIPSGTPPRRLALGVSSNQLVRRIGVNRGTLHRLESERSKPSARLRQALEGELAGGQGNRDRG